MIAETVFQQIEMTLNMIALLLVVILIIAAVGVALLGRITKALSKKETREQQAMRPAAINEPPLPPPLKLTAKDIEESEGMAARNALATGGLFKPKRGD
jgi:ABC-type Fe3+ transport system permease subunit